MAAVVSEIKVVAESKPSPKPRLNAAKRKSKLASSSSQSVAEKPVPLPRKKSSQSSACDQLEAELKDTSIDKDDEPLADYVNCDRERMNDIRKSVLQDSAVHPAAKHVLDVEKKTIGSSSSSGGEDDFEDVSDYINGDINDYMNNPDFTGDILAAMRLDRVSSEFSDDDAFIQQQQQKQDTYVQMTSPMKRSSNEPAQIPGAVLEADNTYIRMGPRSSSMTEDGNTIYQVPKSTLVIEPIRPVPLGGIYELEHTQNPLHPRHLSVALDNQQARPVLSRQATSDAALILAGRKNRSPQSSPVMGTTPRYPPRSPPPNIPLPPPPSGSKSPVFNHRTAKNNRAELVSSWSPSSEVPKNPASRDDRSFTSTASSLKKFLFHSKPDTPPPSKPNGSNSPRMPPIKIAFHGRLKRDVAERRLVSAQAAVGDYLLRESSKVVKDRPQVVISLKTTDAPMHVIVEYKNSQFWLSASQTSQISFDNIEDLLQHYTKQPIVVDGKGSKINLSRPLALKRKA